MLPFQSVIQILKKGLSISKKILIVLVVYTAIVSIFAVVISKEKPKVNHNQVQKNRAELYKEFNNPEYKKTAAGKLSVLLLKTSTCTFIGEGCSENPEDADQNFKKSVFGKMSKLIILPYSQPPASGVYWVYTKLEQSGFVPKSYAAEGLGFASLKPMMNLWMVFRDISYLLLVLVLVSIGFMIMFRMKINPQTVISAENALPKIVTSLILITFSFAIAGFLIDLMYVLMVVGIALISNNNAYYDAAQMQNKYLAGDMWSIYSSLFPIKNMDGFSQLLFTGDAIMGILPPLINNLVKGIVGGAMLLSIFNFVFIAPDATGIGKVLNDINILGTSLGQLPESFIKLPIILVVYLLIGPLLLVHGAGLIVGILVWFTIIFLMFRIFFLLFRSYLSILLLVVFSPIILLLEAVPGKSSFSGWVKNLFAELIGFPVVAIILSLGYVMTNTLAYPGDFWVPPFLFGIDSNAYSVILGLGLMFLIPDFIKMAKEAIGAKPLPFNVGPGTFFAGAGAAGQGGLSIVSQFGSLKLGLNALGMGGGTGFLGLGKAKPGDPVVPPVIKTAPETGDSKPPGT